MKAKEDCAICLTEMNSNGGRIKLTCGHYFHKECLEKTQRPICPLCRAPITIKKCLDIFEDSRIECIVSETLSMPLDIQNHVIDSFELVNGISYIQHGEYANTVNLMLRILRSGCEETNHPELMMNIVKLCHHAITHVVKNNTLVGFVVGFDNNGDLQTL